MQVRIYAVTLLVFLSIQCKKAQSDLRAQEEQLQGIWKLERTTAGGITFYDSTAAFHKRLWFRSDKMRTYLRDTMQQDQPFYIAVKIDQVTRALVPAIILPAASIEEIGTSRTFSVSADTLRVTTGGISEVYSRMPVSPAAMLR